MVEIYMIIANVIAGKNIQDHEGAIFRKQDPSLENKFFDNVASYSSFRNDLTHTSLKESLYTHFTSPMRRYIDIIVHRILSNKFCGSNFVIPEFKECESYNGIIVGFANNKLIVYIKKMGIINVKLFDKKFSELYECKIDKSCELYDKANNKKTEFNINQEINIIISITKYSPKKINAKLAT